MDPILQKLPPQSIEAEESVLSACLLNAAQDVVELLTPDDFYRTSHQKIFKAISEIVTRNEPVDIITLSNHLRDKNQLDEVGGAAAIARLVDTVPTAIHVGEYAKIVKTASQKRRIIEICTRATQEAYNGSTVDEILGSLDQQTAKIQTHSGSFYHIADILPGLLEKWEAQRGKPGPIGITCGLADIDRAFGGFQGSNLYIIGGRPSMGKTAWGLRVARGAAQRGYPVFVISIEMSKELLCTREVSCVSGIDGERFLNGDFQRHHWDLIADATAQLSELPIWIDDSPNAEIKAIQGKIRQFYKKHGRCLVVVDYLQYIQGLKEERADMVIGSITRLLKASARQHDIPVILLAQLNRQLEQRNDKRPVMSDLRGSGEIEQDADIIAFLYRDEVYDPKTEHKGVAEFIVRKFRNGKIGTVFLSWVNHKTTFESIAR